MFKNFLSLVLLLGFGVAAVAAESDPDHCPKNVSKQALGFGPLDIIYQNLEDSLASIAARSANFDFTLSLLRKLLPQTVGTNQNLITAPLGLSTALTMARVGMVGACQSQTDTALGYRELEFGEALRGLTAINASLKNLKSGPRVSIANALWMGKGYAPHPSFRQILSTDFEATVEEVDFATDAAKSRINESVSLATGGMIPSLIEQTSATDVLYLTNAVYLEANWATLFDAAQTREMEFTLPDRSTRQVQMMVRLDRHALLTTPDFDAVRLPLEGGELFVDAFLPKRLEIADFVAGLQRNQLSEWHVLLSAAVRRPRESSLHLPRLKLEFGGDMIPVLQALGMRKPFTSEAGPEMHGMTQSAQDLSLSLVQHQAKLTLTEKGVQAAAGAAVGVSRGLAPSVTFDHPFLILIRNAEGAIVFSGIVSNPG